MSTARWNRREDRELRAGVLDGDADAAEALVARHLDALYEFVHYRMSGDRSAAEDVVQDTFVVAFRLSSAVSGAPASRRIRLRRKSL